MPHSDQPLEPRSLNPHWQAHLARRNKDLQTVEDYLTGLRRGDRVVLSRAITLIESRQHKHRRLAHDLIEACLPYTSRSIRIGITGSPGVGKSTFIESLGLHVLEKDHRIAILTIDPSSTQSKGSILGDKTRMPRLSNHPNAYIRPSASGSSLGGVARKTREAIFLCEAAGFDTIFIETVGVGQSETAAHSMVDFFLLLLLPGAGDDLQGIKRGIVEMADGVVVNKADGERKSLARQAKRHYENALHLFPPKASGWNPEVRTCSALEADGISEVWKMIARFRQVTLDSGYFQDNRQRQARYWMQETVNQRLQELFYQSPGMSEKVKAMEAAVMRGELSSFAAAEALLAHFHAVWKS